MAWKSKKAYSAFRLRCRAVMKQSPNLRRRVSGVSGKGITLLLKTAQMNPADTYGGVAGAG